MPKTAATSCARIVPVPENRAALAAVQDLAAALVSGAGRRVASPLYLHGAPGTGKTSLVSVLVDDLTRRSPKIVVAALSASEWVSSEETVETAQASDLLVLEDVHHLRSALHESFVGVLDERTACRSPTVVTGPAGPQELGLPARLASRLAAGLVVALQPLQFASRLAVLLDKAQRRQIAISRDIIAWVAERFSGGRQLDGALTTLEGLSRLHGTEFDVAMVAEHFAERVEASRPTVEQIAQRVSGHFHVEPRRLRSGQRGRSVVLPRQVGMYLARQLTALSLAQIGKYFGGRDHSTVLHACRKVEKDLALDPVLSGAVRQLRAEFA